MINMLEDVKLGFGTHSTAAGPGMHAGRYRTARALRKAGLLNYGNELTPVGEEALAKALEERAK